MHDTERKLAILWINRHGQCACIDIADDIAYLKMYLSTIALHPDDLHKIEVRTTTTAPTTSAPPLQAKPDQRPPDSGKPAETITVGDQSITFSMTLGVGNSTFRPSAWFEQALLKATKDGQRIEIGGGTDESMPNPKNEMVAKARTTNTREYLINNGIKPDKARARYFTAGGFVADNSTPQDN